MAFLASHLPRFRKFGYVCLKMVTLIDILVQNFTIIFFLVLLRHLFFRLEAKGVGGWGHGTMPPTCATDPVIKVCERL